jgi:hypothetical protein
MMNIPESFSRAAVTFIFYPSFLGIQTVTDRQVKAVYQYSSFLNQFSRNKTICCIVRLEKCGGDIKMLCVIYCIISFAFP